MADATGRTGRDDRTWLLALSALLALVTLSHLLGLGSAPPGLYNDEASIGYNAWAVAHSGLDEHGAHLPLFFQAFGEYKSPVYIYSLAPLTWLGSLTPALVRLPAALSGIAIAALAGVLAHRLTGSRAAVLLSVFSAGFEPWLWSESRVAFEPIVMVLLLLAAVVLLARRPVPRPSDFGLAGLAIAVSAYTYSSARLFGALLAGAVLLVHFSGGRRRRTPGWWWLIPPVAVGYLGLLGYERAHPGILLARYSAISIGSDGAGVPVLLGRFAGNYLQYLGPSFLFTHGDANPRHNSGFGGMLSVAILPVLVLGVVTLVRRRHERFARLVLLGLLLAPVPAALTAEGTPHGLRATTMLPFLLVAIALGWGVVARHLSGRPLLAGAVGLILLSSYGGYLWDYTAEFPGRSVLAWDTGEAPAIADGHRLAAGHRLLVSTGLDQAYIQALFVLRPAPADYARQGLGSVGVVLAAGQDLAGLSRPGDTLVLAPGDTPPGGARLVEQLTYSVDRHGYDIARGATVPVALASVWQQPATR
ncbi:MAG: hypothetical protein M3010_01275 [Candidatus Dormibacteraeota bacterium]|nr:hypothetical protein [Candidatus Dormibacteraeota bacterium]